MTGFLSVLALATFATLLSAAAATAASAICNDYRGQIMSYEVGGCDWSERCYARPPNSSAIGCYQMTNAALADVGWKTSAGQWLANPYGIRSDQEFAGSIAAQNRALDIYTALNWDRLGDARSLVGTQVAGVRITEGGLLSATHFLGPGGMRGFAECGFRPDCIPADAAAANGGRDQAWRIAMGRLQQGSGTNVADLTGVHTPGGGGRLTGFGSEGPAIPAGAFLPWSAVKAREQPPLQGERKGLR